MKKLFSLLCAMLVVMSASAFNVKKVAKTGLVHHVTRTFEHKSAIKHAPVAVADLTFSIDVTNITATTADVTVTPSDNSSLYYFDIMSIDEYDNILNGAYAQYGINSVADYENYFIVNNDYGVDAQTYLSYLGSTGVDGYSYSSLTPNAEYVVVALAVDASYSCVEPATTFTFKTGNVEESSLVLTITYDGTNLTINASNDDPYFFWIESKDEYETWEPDYSDASLIDDMEEWIASLAQFGYTDYAVLSGNQVIDPENDFWTMWMGDAMESGEYVAMAAPYAGALNGAPAYVIFTFAAAPVEPVDDFAGTIVASGITDTIATITVTPVDTTLLYYWDITTKEEYDAAVSGAFASYEINNFLEYAQYMVDYTVNMYQQYGYTVSATDLAVTGADTYTYEGLDPATEYVAYAFSMDAAGKLSGAPVMIVFTTLGGAQAIESNAIKANATKALINNAIVIEKAGVKYNVVGARL